MQPGSPPYLATLVGRSYEVLDQRELAGQFLDFAAKAQSMDLRPIRADTPLDVAAKRGPQSGRDAVALVRGLIGAGQTGSAIANAANFLQRTPGSGDALALMGDAYLADGQGKQAADYYARAAAIRQPWALTRRMYAAEISAGRTRSGLTLLEHQLASNSGNMVAAIILAEAELAGRNPRKAALLLDLAIANGAGRDPHAMVLRAQAALELNDLDTAREAAMRAYSLQRMNHDATAALAAVLAKTDGETGQGAELTQKALKLRER